MTSMLLSALPPSAELRIISRAGLLPRQGECRDEHLGCLAGAEPAGEGSAAVTAVPAAVRPAVLPGGIAGWTGSSPFTIMTFLLRPAASCETSVGSGRLPSRE